MSEILTLPTDCVSETQITESSSNTTTAVLDILPIVAKAQVKVKKRKAVNLDLLVQRDIKALLKKEGNQGDSSQHVTEESMMSLNPLRDLPPSEKADFPIEFQDISPQDTCEDQEMAAPDLMTNPLSSQDMTTQPQGTSSPAREAQKMAGPDRITEPPFQDLSVITKPQEPSSPIYEDRKTIDPDQITDPPPSQDLSVTPKPPESSLPVCQNQKMAGPHQNVEPLPFQNSTPTEPQGTSSTCEDQIMTAADQNAGPLLSQDTSVVAELREISLPACGDQTMTGDQTMEPLPSQDTSAATEAQVTSSQIVAEDRPMPLPGSIGEPSSLQRRNEPQDYSSQTVIRDQEMEAGNTVEASLPSQDARVATEPQSSFWHSIAEEQEKREIIAGNSEDSVFLLRKTSSSIETQGSAAQSIREGVTTLLQSSMQSKTRNMVSSDHVGNIPSSVQGIPPLTQSASADNLVMGSSRNAMAACQRKFGQEMRIVAYRKGLRKQCTMSFTCTISSALFPKVSAWLNRNTFLLHIEDSLCLSLGCYSITELQEESIQDNCTTLEQKTSVAQSHWPQRGGLSMNVQFKNEREDLPLSPPFQVTPDGLVDVSQFLFAGQNTIKLKQTTDMSQYIFVLHSHNPTRAQLQGVEGRRQRDKEWQDWARHVSRPFDIPSKLFLQT